MGDGRQRGRAIPQGRQGVGELGRQLSLGALAHKLGPHLVFDLFQGPGGGFPVVGHPHRYHLVGGYFQGHAVKALLEEVGAESRFHHLGVAANAAVTAIPTEPVALLEGDAQDLSGGLEAVGSFVHQGGQGFVLVVEQLLGFAAPEVGDDFCLHLGEGGDSFGADLVDPQEVEAKASGHGGSDIPRGVEGEQRIHQGGVLGRALGLDGTQLAAFQGQVLPGSVQGLVEGVLSPLDGFIEGLGLLLSRCPGGLVPRWGGE